MESYGFQVKASIHKPLMSPPHLDHLKTSLSSTLKPFLKELQQFPLRLDIPKAITDTSKRLLNTFVDSVFQFVDQPYLPSQSNFAPVEEIGHVFLVTDIEGEIPDDFPAGVFVRNGPNPLFGGLKSTVSWFGQSSHSWIEGEGMLHALYFTKNDQGSWTISYNNRYVETDTFNLEKSKNRPSFLPALEGDSPAILAAYLFNLLRFGKVNKHISNTNIFAHAGKIYSIAENYLPQMISLDTLQTHDNWDIGGAWDRPFASHPKKAPGTGELVVVGVDAVKPYFVLGVVSADGKKLVHKVDIKLSRSSLCHEIGITQKYNVIMDLPLTIDINRLIRGGPLMKYETEGYARIGVMPRYGVSDSVKWFEVEPHCTFHILNCFEDGDEVVVRGCRALRSIIPGPDFGRDKLEWFSRVYKPIDNGSEDGLYFSRPYEWRLNMKTGQVKERNLIGAALSMDFPAINECFIGLGNKYAYLQVLDSNASSSCGMAKYGMLAKLCFEEPEATAASKIGEYSESKELIKTEYHKFDMNCFCSGTSFVPKDGSFEEDDGWIICLVHNEENGITQAHIIDAKRFQGEPVVKVTLPQRVPYGFHSAYFPTPITKQAS